MTNKVNLQPRSFSFEINENETILDAARRQGFDVPYSCRQASCGVCRARLLSGEVFYEEDLIIAGISEEEIQQGFVLPCNAYCRGDIHLQWQPVFGPGEIPPKKFTAEVLSVRAFNRDTFEIRLRLSGLQRLKFYAGQYLQIIMPDGEKRAFSIASAPQQLPEMYLHARAMPGHESAEQVLAHLRAHTVITVEMPFGEAYLRSGDRPLLLIAGGTGAAPMWSIMQQWCAQQDKRSVSFYWGATTESALYLNVELRVLAQQSDLHYVPVLSQGSELWQGERGLPHMIALRDHPRLNAFDIYLGGSPEMAKAIYPELLKAGADKSRIFCDWLQLMPEHFSND